MLNGADAAAVQFCFLILVRFYVGGKQVTLQLSKQRASGDTEHII